MQKIHELIVMEKRKFFVTNLIRIIKNLFLIETQKKKNI